MIRRGYHYTSWEAWQSIQKCGELQPRCIDHPDFKTLGLRDTQVIWTWWEPFTGMSHYGSILFQMHKKRTLCVVLISYNYDTRDCYGETSRSNAWTFQHKGDLGTTLGDDSHCSRWVYHDGTQTSHLLMKPVPLGDIKVEAIYDFSGFVDQADSLRDSLPAMEKIWA